MKHLKINLKRQYITCHSNAKKPYMISQKFTHLLKTKNCTKSFLEQFNFFSPIIAIKEDKSNFSFFGNWEFLDLMIHKQLTHANVLIYHNISAEQIEKLAWHYLLTHYLSGLDKKAVLSDLALLLDEAPHYIKAELFENALSYSSIKTIENLTHQSRSAIRYQRKKNTR
jgi:hypothetical protein